MELTTKQGMSQEKPTETPVIYTAVGCVAGTYQPSPDDFEHGSLLTEDGQTIWAELHWHLRNQLKQKHPEDYTPPNFLLTSSQWTVYPQTEPLRFKLVRMKPLHSTQSAHVEAELEPGKRPRQLDQFRIVGEIESCSDQTVTIRIRRNEQPRKGQEDKPEYQPFVLTLGGSLPTEAVGQIWELEARREGKNLLVVAGRLYEPSSADLVWLQKQQKQHSTAKKATGYAELAAAAKATPLPSPVIKPKPPGQTPAPKQSEQPMIDAINAPSKGAAVPSTSEAKKASKSTAVDSNANTTLIAGKMEVVVKLNQFPDQVKTVDSGWKEFSVDADGCIVTITVKPKAFAALEQAQQTYPSWVAAISGQMGSATATGFRMESPTIQVFERKAKETFGAEQITSQDNSVQAQVVESQLPAPGKTPIQKQVVNPQLQSSNATTKGQVTEHLKQQQPTQMPQHPEQKQQREQPLPGGKHSTSSTPLASPQSDSPRFSVTVNGQVFSGRDSVTLNKRVVRIDGVTVGQAKTVVVLGQPKTIQADGGVSQVRNQAVLTSR